jgi:hypothetical protein
LLYSLWFTQNHLTDKTLRHFPPLLLRFVSLHQLFADLLNFTLPEVFLLLKDHQDCLLTSAVHLKPPNLPHLHQLPESMTFVQLSFLELHRPSTD